MSTPSRFKKDKEIIAEYESQVKGKHGALQVPRRPEGRGAAAEGRVPAAGGPPGPPAPSPGLRDGARPTAATAGRAGGRCCLNFSAGGSREGAVSRGLCSATRTPGGIGSCEGAAGSGDGRQLRRLSAPRPRRSTFPSSPDFGNTGGRD